MNVSRLSDFAAKLVAVEAQFNVGKRLGRVASKLQEVVSQPQNPQFQTELVGFIVELRKSVEELEAQITPAMADFLRELGGLKFFSKEMVDDIDGEIHRNSITHAVAKSYVDDIVSRRNKFVEALKSLSASLTSVGLKPKPLEPGHAEIGFKIPRSIFDNRLIGFSGELKFIERVVEVFSEAVTGERQEAELSELSTTDPLVLLQLYAPIVAAIAASVTWFLATYKQTLEIRQLKAQIRKLEIDDTSQFDKEIEQIIQKAVEERIGQVLAPREDQGRKNEVENGLRLVLRDMWARVERGMTVEVRFLPPAAKPNATAEEAREAKAYKDLERIQRELVFPAIEGEPMLELPKAETSGDGARLPKAVKATRGGRGQKKASKPADGAQKEIDIRNRSEPDDTDLPVQRS
jgi:hypothetical protein